MSSLETAAFGAGCFWGVEETLRRLKGVKETAVGYMGGPFKDPTYEDVCGGQTGHAEMVEIQFDPAEISYDDLLEVFWECHNPATLNRQGQDIGEQYRSVIFYHSPEQEQAARKSRETLEKSGKWKSPIVTEISPASTFNRAEEYHQQYLKKRGLGGCPIS